MSACIRLANITHTYPVGKQALNKVDLEIPLGGIFALLGPNGAGKTTLTRLLAGRLLASEGKIILPDFLCTADGSANMNKVGVLVENPGIYPKLRVREYLEFFGQFYAVSDLSARIEELCSALAINDREQFMGTLSLGMRQKIQIIRTLLHKPTLVLLDEPTANLDPMARHHFWNLLSTENAREGTTVLLCSHVLGEVEQHCTHLAFLREGCVLEAGSYAHLMARKPCRVIVELCHVFPENSLVFPDRLLREGVEQGKIDGQILQYQCTSPRKCNPLVAEFLREKGISFWRMNVEKPALETLYRQHMEAQ